MAVPGQFATNATEWHSAVARNQRCCSASGCKERRDRVKGVEQKLARSHMSAQHCPIAVPQPFALTHLRSGPSHGQGWGQSAAEAATLTPTAHSFILAACTRMGLRTRSWGPWWLTPYKSTTNRLRTNDSVAVILPPTAITTFAPFAAIFPCRDGSLSAAWLTGRLDFGAKIPEVYVEYCLQRGLPKIRASALHLVCSTLCPSLACLNLCQYQLVHALRVRTSQAPLG